MKKLLIFATILLFTNQNNLKATINATLNDQIEIDSLSLQSPQTSQMSTQTDQVQEGPVLRDVAECNCINSSIKFLIKFLYPIEGLGKFLGWGGATVATLAATARDLFPQYDFLSLAQKLGILSGVAGGLIYAGSKYAVDQLERVIANFEEIRKETEFTP